MCICCVILVFLYRAELFSPTYEKVKPKCAAASGNHLILKKTLKKQHDLSRLIDSRTIQANECK